MIIRGGENIYPREVEEYLFRHPKVQDVQVVGLPDKKYGEELCAWIMLREGQKATEAEIRAFCDGQIAHYKIPKYIRFVESFPMTVTGKVQKYLIRQKMKDELALDGRQERHEVQLPGNAADSVNEKPNARVLSGGWRRLQTLGNHSGRACPSVPGLSRASASCTSSTFLRNSLIAGKLCCNATSEARPDGPLSKA
jgi:hypothetical protein